MILKILILLFTISCLALTILPYTDIWPLYADAADQLRVYVAATLVVLFILSVLYSSYFISMIQLILICVQACVITLAYPLKHKSHKTCENAQTPIRVMSYNILYKNDRVEEILANIAGAQPDIVVLQEAQETFLDYSHKSFTKTHPFFYPNYEEGKKFTVTLYSKYPIKTIEKPQMPRSKRQILHAQIERSGKIIDLIGLHSTSPKDDERLHERNLFLQDVADYAQNKVYENPNIRLILAGDFNSAPWTPPMRNIQNQARLLGNPSILNYFGTWPAWAAPLFSVPIDHIFYTKNFHNENYTRKSYSSGSDHFPIYADFYLCE